jgi:hypothetical protein
MSAARPLRVWSSRVAGWLAPREPRRPARPRASADLVGRDFSGRRAGRPALARALPALLAGLLVAALALSALRVELIRLRYGLGQAMHEEKALLEESRALRARVGSLRDPQYLARLAPRFGLARPARVIELPAAPDADPRR